MFTDRPRYKDLYMIAMKNEKIMQKVNLNHRYTTLNIEYLCLNSVCMPMKRGMERGQQMYP